MRFAKVVFWCAAVWGFLALTPLYFLFDTIGRQNPPAITHPLSQPVADCTDARPASSRLGVIAEQP